MTEFIHVVFHEYGPPRVMECFEHISRYRPRNFSQIINLYHLSGPLNPADLQWHPFNINYPVEPNLMLRNKSCSLAMLPSRFLAGTSLHMRPILINGMGFHMLKRGQP